jgi:hypothetical protein
MPSRNRRTVTECGGGGAEPELAVVRQTRVSSKRARPWAPRGAVIRVEDAAVPSVFARRVDHGMIVNSCAVQ